MKVLPAPLLHCINQYTSFGDINREKPILNELYFGNILIGIDSHTRLSCVSSKAHWSTGRQFFFGYGYNREPFSMRRHAEQDRDE